MFSFETRINILQQEGEDWQRLHRKLPAHKVSDSPIRYRICLLHDVNDSMRAEVDGRQLRIMSILERKVAFATGIEQCYTELILADDVEQRPLGPTNAFNLAGGERATNDSSTTAE
jgi:hypothetical protein